MRVVICVPWRSAPDRDEIWNYVRARFEPFGEVIVGDTYAPVFHMAAASNAAVRAAGDWDVMIYTGADCVPESPRQVHEAVALAADGAFVAAHDKVVRLTREATMGIIASGRAILETDTAESAVGLTWEGTRVIGRPLWDQFGGFDERLTSGEGLAFSWSCGTLARKQMRTSGVLYHLWHEYRWSTPEAIERVRAANAPLRDRYHAAAGNPSAIRAMLAESTQSRAVVTRA